MFPRMVSLLAVQGGVEDSDYFSSFGEHWGCG